MRNTATITTKAPAASKAAVQPYTDSITLRIDDPGWVRRLRREAAEKGITAEEWVECMMRATTVICEPSPRGISVRMSIIELHNKLGPHTVQVAKWTPPGQPSPRLRN